ncbi:hypothetical protein ACFE04_004524 [Oxalis oulophora]
MGTQYLHIPHYDALSDKPILGESPKAESGKLLKVLSTIVFTFIFVLSFVALIISRQQGHEQALTSGNQDVNGSKRSYSEGVSAKSNPSVSNENVSFNWTDSMFLWQRSAYHFQPEKNWMNGPLYHNGWYHLFYQYNPDSAIWGNITWGHTVSRDLIHWLYLPLALVPSKWYDINGVWTGSATLLPNGQIRMLYTGDTDEFEQVQCLATPANLSDPLLLNWVKSDANPVILPPSGIGHKDFRDPSTAWTGPDGTYRILIGSKHNTTGIAMVFQTTNFTTFDLLPGILHSVPGTGMWECVDFYPVAVNASVYLDTSAYGPGIKHVLKASIDNLQEDYYAVGTYHPVNHTWTPDYPELDVGIGLRYDYGKYYASKTFYDQNKSRRILWGWTRETDTAADDLEKGWASVQTIPRTVLFDNKTGVGITEWPVEELESLRINSTEFSEIVVEPGKVVHLDIGSADQLDITAEFEIDLLESTSEEDDIECGVGSDHRSSLGPFGILVLADEKLTELTPIYFRPTNASNSTLNHYFCVDESRSSLATGVYKKVYGTQVPVLEDEKLSMRVLVDHSVVESFSQGGRRVITARVYPTEAIYGAAKLFLFNNATQVNVKVTLKVWEMESADIHPYPL